MDGNIRVVLSLVKILNGYYICVQIDKCGTRIRRGRQQQYIPSSKPPAHSTQQAENNKEHLPRQQGQYVAECVYCCGLLPASPRASCSR